MQVITTSAFQRRIIGAKNQPPPFLFPRHSQRLSGANRTTVPIIAPTKSSPAGFGSVTMIDDPLTHGQKMNSGIVGRAQGVYISVDLQKIGLLMTMNLLFTEGEFNGSKLGVVGRNKVFSSTREMPVVGGTEVFWFGHGYALAKTYPSTIQLNPRENPFRIVCM